MMESLSVLIAAMTVLNQGPNNWVPLVLQEEELVDAPGRPHERLNEHQDGDIVRVLITCDSSQRCDER